MSQELKKAEYQGFGTELQTVEWEGHALTQSDPVAQKRGSVLGSQDAVLGPFEHLDFWLYFLLKKQHGHK